MSMLQVIGHNKCKDTQKVIRYLKERRIEFQYIDLKQRKLSQREYESIYNSIKDESYLDKSSKYYIDNGYSYRVYDPKEEVILHPELLKTPILRNKNKAVIGVDEAFIKESIC